VKRHPATPCAQPLIHRECLVLDRIGRDRTHKDIAAELGVSINTVANLAAKAYRKLDAHGMDRLHADAHSDRRRHP
jgi:DNA-binding CsgD family transcriptional regulator